MIDLHSHILPGMDDGSDSVQKSLQMLSIYADEGFNTVAATHHFNSEDMSVDDYDRLWHEKFQELQSAAENEYKNIRIVKGAEVSISPLLPEMKGLRKLCINGSRYFLLELSPYDIPFYTEELIYRLRLKGFVPIIAHPERNVRIMEKPDLLRPLAELGALIQINAGSVAGLFGRKAEKCAKILLTHNMAHIISTDAHSIGRRSPRIKETVRKLGKWTGPSNIDMMLNRTPEAVINDRFLEVDSPLPYKKHMLFFFSKRGRGSRK
ncbi:MAG: tyrosine-protein phosphatase [Caldicoprobacterales bacterium]|jgi:protein-tyrosine phosphatase